MLQEEVWIGPKVCTSLVDTVILPLFIGGDLVDDTKITLQDLFQDGVDETGTMYVHDIGAWWSHSICVSKVGDTINDEDNNKIAKDGFVTFLLNGFGGAPCEDSEGVKGYCQSICQLSGSLPNDDGMHLDPSSEEWWVLFNEEIRKKHNKKTFCLS